MRMKWRESNGNVLKEEKKKEANILKKRGKNIIEEKERKKLCIKSVVIKVNTKI